MNSGPKQEQCRASPHTCSGLTNDSDGMSRAEHERYIAFQAIASSLNGVILTDVDDRIAYANPAFAAMFGYDGADAVLGRDSAELFSGSMMTSLADVERQTRAAAGMQHEFLGRHRDGSEFPVMVACTTVKDAAGRPVGRMASFVDITARKQAQQELRDREQRYRELVENANSIIMRITPECRITFLNLYAQRFFGFSVEEIVGRDVAGTILPEIDSDGRDLKKVIEETAARPEEHGVNDTEAVRKDGARAWIHWTNRAVRDKRGRVKEILCVGTDITERKRLERESVAYRRRLRSLADRLTAKEEQERRRAAAKIHDTVIQTLSLSNIRLGGVMAALEKAGMSDQRKRVDGVRRLLDQGIKECRGLMEEMMPAMLYEVGLHAALRDFAQKQSSIEGNRITVEGNDDGAPMDDALRSLLFQCARELTMNALKHAGRCEIRLAVSATDGHVGLQVQDTGRGFDPAKHAGREHDEEGGFGLFNIRERIEGLGGRLDIDSAPGSGTTAKIQVPLVPPR